MSAMSLLELEIQGQQNAAILIDDDSDSPSELQSKFCFDEEGALTIPPIEPQDQESWRNEGQIKYLHAALLSDYKISQAVLEASLWKGLGSHLNIREFRLAQCAVEKQTRDRHEDAFQRVKNQTLNIQTLGENDSDMFGFNLHTTLQEHGLRLTTEYNKLAEGEPIIKDNNLINPLKTIIERSERIRLRNMRAWAETRESTTETFPTRPFSVEDARVTPGTQVNLTEAMRDGLPPHALLLKAQLEYNILLAEFIRQTIPKFSTFALETLVESWHLLYGKPTVEQIDWRRVPHLASSAVQGCWEDIELANTMGCSSLDTLSHT